MTENQLTLTGNITAEPELRYTQNGIPVASFTVAYTPRTFDRANNEWKDGTPLFMRCTAWRDLGENASKSLAKGTRVTVVGEIKQSTYKDRDGNDRTSIDLDVSEVAVSLRYSTVSGINRAQTSGAQQNNRQAAAQQGGQSTNRGPAQQEVWATPGGASAYGDDTPF